MFTKVSSKRWSIMLMIFSLIVSLGVLSFSPVSAQDLTQTQDTFANIYNQVSPSVVAISVEKPADTQTQVMPGFGQPKNQQPQYGLGSGFVMNTDGYIITNAHVVDGATSIEVDFNDGTLARAQVVGIDVDSDIAVVQVQDVSADVLHPVTFADSDALYVGQPVLAIGSPFGERWTLTSGIISGLDRVIHGLTDFSIGNVVQTDAAINPGNSGGPLLNLNGEVVGVNAQIVSGSGTNSGVGFAIPGNLAQRVANQLIDNGYVEYSYLGISGGDVNLSAIEDLGLANNTRGVLVAQVVQGSPASRAGLNSMEMAADGETIASADIITAINDQPLFTIADLISYLAQRTQPGDTVTLSILRNGTDKMSVDVRLIPRPQKANIS